MSYKNRLKFLNVINYGKRKTKKRIKRRKTKRIIG